MTRSPMSVLLITVLAPIEQSRPIRTPAPITAFAPTAVPLPISTSGPITAPGSMATPSSVRALVSTCAPAKSPGLDKDDGRKACGNNSRATITNARYGSRVINTETWFGSSLASAAVVRHAPACVVAAAAAKFLLSRNARSRGPARSSGAIFMMRSVRADRVAICAPVTLAISSSVRPADCRKNVDSLILPESDPSLLPGVAKVRTWCRH